MLKNHSEWFLPEITIIHKENHSRRNLIFLCPATRKWRGIMLYPPKFWVSVRPSVRLSVCPSVRPSAPTTILVSATPPTVLGQSFWNFTGVLRMVWRYAYCFFRILKLFLSLFSHFYLRHFSSPYTTDMYMEYVPWIGNSSYSFWRILLKLYRCFKDGLKICILFFQNPEIIFITFFAFLT